MILYLFSLICFLFGVLYTLYIPLPIEMADRWKMQLVELYFRIGYLYLGHLVEVLFGPIARNRLLRTMMEKGLGPFARIPKHIKVEKDMFGGVPVLIYSSKVNVRTSKAALVFIHGGGWVTMRPEHYGPFIAELIDRLGILVVSIEYRLSPEYPYPAAVEDCESAVRELLDNRFEKLGLERDRIGIIGDSAGGNLTAVTSQRLLKQGYKIKCQVLLYPVIHVFSFKSQSFMEYYEKMNGATLINPTIVARVILHYFGIEASQENVDKMMDNQHMPNDVPACFTDILHIEGLEAKKFGKAMKNGTIRKTDPFLSSIFKAKGFDPSVSPIFGATKDLPPTLMVTVGFDVLRDEGIQYARLLQQLGVECEWNHYPNAYHAIINMARGIALHETLHALGLNHQHLRMDRDQHLTIEWSNINPQHYDYFVVADSKLYTTYGVKYDYGSIMHYNAYTAAVNIAKPTMIPKVNPQSNTSLLGQRNGMSKADIEILKKMYCMPGCDDKNVYCGAWALKDLCKNPNNDRWMSANCRKSCNLCGAAG